MKYLRTKRLIVLMIAVATVFCCFPAGGVSAKTVEGDFTYEEIAGGVKIVATTADAPSVVIPETLGGKPVVELGQYLFNKSYYRKNLESVVLPEGLLVIGDGVFMECERLTQVNIPSTVTKIGHQAFESSAVSHAELPEGLTSVGLGAFRWTKVESLRIPASLTKIGMMAFAGCNELKELTVAEGHPTYTSVNNCIVDGDRTVVLGCKTSVIPGDGSVTKIGPQAFRYLSFETFTVPSCITEIGEYAFAQCGMKEIVLSEGLQTIGREAFSGCPYLESVKLPASVKTVESEAFLMCEALREVELSPGLEKLGELDFAHCDNLTSVKIPEGVLSIGNMAFNGAALEELVLPGSLKAVGFGAFGECESLKTVRISASVEELQGAVFGMCTALTDIYCEAAARPAGWAEDWLNDCTAEVHWGAASAVKLGDLDGNGKVNVLDYGMLKSYVMNMFVLTDAQKEV
ncbi:MAG: leucine-rich repeat protein, partial [Clostridia bacterium]|nr:leucine-rich repeat protein [Clostridia bacterium]